MPVWAAALLLCAPAHGAMDMLAIPQLEPTLMCSACEVTMREIFLAADAVDAEFKIQTSHRTGTDRKVNYKKSELFATEVLENACNIIGSKYKLAQENWGGHNKIFCDVNDKIDVTMCEPPDWYAGKEDSDFRYYATGVRLPHRCRELVGEHEDDLVDAIMTGKQMGVMRKKLCEKECSGPVMDEYKKSEREARRKWRKRTGRAKGQEPPKGRIPLKTVGSSAAMEDPDLPGAQGEIDSRRYFHDDKKRQKEREEREQKEAEEEEERKKAREKRATILKEAKDREERIRKNREQTKGQTFSEWQAEQRKKKEEEEELEEKKLRAWEEKRRRKRAKKEAARRAAEDEADEL